MVYSGKPSSACRTCRQRRIRCDELRPSCTQCIKTRKECQGYPDAIELSAQDRTRKPQRLNGRRGSRSPASTPASDVTDGSSPDSTLSVLIANPAASVKTAAACFFLDGMLVTPLSSGRNVGHLEYVPKFYLKALPSSTLAICTDAASLAAFSNFGREDGAITTEALQCYGQAVMSLHNDLKDPVMLQKNETLMSTLIMLVVESLLAKSKAPSEQWSAHVFGAVRLLMTRGQAVFEDPIASRLYNVTRIYLENGSREQGVPLPPLFAHPAPVYSSRSSMELQTVAILTSMADLRRVISLALQSEGPGDSQNLSELISECQRSDQVVLHWVNNLPDEHLYDTEPNTPGTEPDFPFATPHHQYKDSHSHRMWNSYRCARICLNIHAYRCLSKLSDLSGLDYTADIAFCLSNAQTMANQICQSLPAEFYTARPASSFNNKRDVYSAITAYHLLWPFYLAQNVPTLPPIQRQWIRSNMVEIADRYELRHAMVLVDAMDKDPNRPLFTSVWRDDAIEYVWEYNFMYSSGAV